MGSCNDKNWSPDLWSTLTMSLSGSSHALTNQSFYWFASSMAAYKAKGGSYVYEVRRNKDVWDFVRPGFLCLYCFREYSTNLPGLYIIGNTFLEEADLWLRICCLLTGDDEEAELKGPIDQLQAYKWYVAQLKFYRKKKNQSFTCWSENEWCGGLPYTGCNFGQDFEWCTMSERTFTS